MKPSHRFWAALGLLVWPLLPGWTEPPAAYQPMRIEQTWEPAFPQQATDLNLSDGTASVVVAIDASGRLMDSLVVAYSHPAFAATAVEAVRKWKYAAARLDGEPIATTKEIAFRFEQHGMVLVTVTATEYIESQMRGLNPHDTSYRAYALNEIDRALTLTRVVRPGYPTELRARGIAGTVALEYYVDENGRVRMPVVTNRVAPELAGLAVGAVQQWQFAPPLRHGQPVLVRVGQEFRFNKL